jgi:hypothetical protein
MVDIKFPIMRRRKLAALGSVIALECALSQFQKTARAVIREAFVIRPLILELESNGPCRTRSIAAEGHSSATWRGIVAAKPSASKFTRLSVNKNKLSPANEVLKYPF